MMKFVKSGRAALAATAVLAMGCGASGGSGGGGFGGGAAVTVGGAPGTTCQPAFADEGCGTENNVAVRVKCVPDDPKADLTSPQTVGKWTTMVACTADQKCIATKVSSQGGRKEGV